MWGYGGAKNRLRGPSKGEGQRGGAKVPSDLEMQQKRWPGSFESFDEILPLSELLHAQPLGRGPSLGQCEG
jgi:hypothetical protein